MGPAQELAAIRRADLEASLDDILSRWHHWQLGAKVSRGYGDRALVVGEYRASRQYDDQNGALDDAIESATMRQVDFEVREMPDPWRSAIYAIARGIYAGSAVFHSPRIAPADRARIEPEARARLTARLLAAGVLQSV